jgi:hypothetical protein
MPDQNSEPVTAPAVSPAVSVATEAAQILVGFVPGLGQYAVAIDLAFAVAEKVEPAVYQEIRGLIDTIKNGNVPSDAEKQRLAALVSSLQTPESYFKTKLDEAKAVVEMEKQVRAAQLAAEAKIVPPDKQPGYCP